MESKNERAFEENTHSTQVEKVELYGGGAVGVLLGTEGLVSLICS